MSDKTAVYAGRKITARELAQLRRINAEARRAQDIIQRRLDRQLSNIVGTTAKVVIKQRGRKRPELKAASEALDILLREATWQHVELEDAAVRAALDILGIDARDGVGTFKRIDGVNVVELIREEFDLEQQPADKWESFFLRDADAYAKTYGLSDLPREEIEASARRRAVTWSQAYARRELAISRRGAASGALKDRGLRRYRRVVNGETCAYCHLIASRIYYVQDMLPAHDRCDCGVLPVPAEHAASDGSDPAAVLNASDRKNFASTADGAHALERAIVKIQHDPHYGPSIVGKTPPKEHAA